MREGLAQSSLFGGAIQQQNIELKVKEMLNILDWVPTDNLSRLLTAAGPKVAKLCIPALLRTEHRTSESEKSLKALKLIEECINYLLNGTSDLFGETGVTLPRSSSPIGGYRTEVSATDDTISSNSQHHPRGQNHVTDQPSHQLHQCDTYHLDIKCHAQENLAFHSIFGSCKLDRQEPASAENLPTNPDITLGQLYASENNAGDSPTLGGFLLIESTKDKSSMATSGSEGAEAAAHSPAGYDYLIPLSPSDSPWMEI
jgi:hypothetical protein